MHKFNHWKSLVPYGGIKDLKVRFVSFSNHKRLNYLYFILLDVAYVLYSIIGNHIWEYIVTIEKDGTE